MLRLIFALLISFTLNAQNATLSWSATFGGTASGGSLGLTYARVAHHIATDRFNNVLVTGYFSMGSTDFDPGAGTYSLIPASVDPGDLFVAKLNASGQLMWVRQLGNVNQGVIPLCVTSDSSCNVYVSGAFTGYIDFNPGAATANLSSGAGNGFLLKLDSAGTFSWVKQLGGACLGVHIDQQENIYLTGEFTSTKDFDPGANTSFLTFSDTYFPDATDGFLCKLDAQGNFVWVKQFKGIMSQTPWTVTSDNTGNVFITGNYRGAIDCDPGSSDFWLYADCGESSMFVIKLDASGGFLWAKSRLQFLADFPTGKLIDTDAAGNSYVAGKALSSYSPAGDLRWSHALETTALTTDSEGNVLVTGSFSGIQDFDFDTSPGDTALRNASEGSVYIGKYSGDGTLIQAVQYGKNDPSGWPQSDSFIRIKDITSDASGQALSVGYYTGNPDIHPNQSALLFLSCPGNPYIENSQIFVQKVNFD